MVRRSRDNFSKDVLNKLFKRVGGHCSNPNCRVPTTGPDTSTPHGVINIGVGGHITAASPKGPRFNSALSSQERASIDNAIWLCQNCAKLVDADDSNITVNTLLDWKKRAEGEAKRMLGQQPSELSLAKTNRLSSAIHDALSSEKNRLESLDNRIEFQLEHNGKNLIYKMSAKEDFSCHLHIKSNSDSLVEKLKLHYEEGESVKIRVDEFRFEGSDALEALAGAGQSGDFILGSREFPCQYVIHGVTKVGKEFEFSFDGLIRGGSRKIKCFISTDHLPIRGHYDFERDGNQLINSELNFGLDFDVWKGCSLISLVGFDLAKNIYGNLASGEIEISHSIKGHHLFNVFITQNLSSDMGRKVTRGIALLEKCIKIANYYHVNPIFTGFNGMTQDEIEQIEMVYELITNGKMEVDGSTSRASTKIEITAENLTLLRDASKPGADNLLKFVENQSELILFGIKIQLGSISFSITKSKISSDVDLTKAKLGEVVPIDWIGHEGSKTIIEFEKSVESQ